MALSKVLDAEELSCLVRTKLGVDVDGRPLHAGLCENEKDDFASARNPKRPRLVCGDLIIRLKKTNNVQT